jgi:hypothetical protein
MGVARRNLQAQSKILKKMIGTPNLPIRTKKFPKKVCFVPYKCKRAKNSYGGYWTEFAGSTQNPKKIIVPPNIPINTKIFLKKQFFVP